MRLRVPAAHAWLSVTPEPERLLPAAVATLAAGSRPAAETVARERARVDRVIARARLGAWLDYLSRALALAEQREGAADADVVRAREETVAVISNHHQLLLALPGSAARRTTAERERLRALRPRPQRRSERG